MAEVESSPHINDRKLIISFADNDWPSYVYMRHIRLKIETLFSRGHLRV